MQDKLNEVRLLIEQLDEESPRRDFVLEYAKVLALVALAEEVRMLRSVVERTRFS
jgi:hypothetical protein